VERRRHAVPAPGAGAGPEQAERLAARGIAVVSGEVAALEVAGDRLAGCGLPTAR
jgi:hypothetical protein